MFFWNKQKANVATIERKKYPDYVNWWLFRDKGTITEPWSTAEELMKDPNVQNQIQKVREIFNTLEKQKE